MLECPVCKSTNLSFSGSMEVMGNSYIDSDGKKKYEDSDITKHHFRCDNNHVFVLNLNSAGHVVEHNVIGTIKSFNQLVWEA